MTQIIVKLPKGNYNITNDFNSSADISIFSKKIIKSLKKLAPDKLYKNRLSHYSEIVVILQEFVESGAMKREDWGKIVNYITLNYL